MSMTQNNENGVTKIRCVRKRQSRLPHEQNRSPPRKIAPFCGRCLENITEVNAFSIKRNKHLAQYDMQV